MWLLFQTEFVSVNQKILISEKDNQRILHVHQFPEHVDQIQLVSVNNARPNHY